MVVKKSVKAQMYVSRSKSLLTRYKRITKNITQLRRGGVGRGGEGRGGVGRGREGMGGDGRGWEGRGWHGMGWDGRGWEGLSGGES